MKHSFFKSFILLVILAVGCSTIPEGGLPTPTSLSENTANDPQSFPSTSTNTPVPTRTPIPTVALPTPYTTLEPTIDPVPLIVVNTNDDSDVTEIVYSTHLLETELHSFYPQPIRLINKIDELRQVIVSFEKYGGKGIILPYSPITILQCRG